MTHPTSRKLPLATAIAAVITGATCPPLALAQEQQLEEIVVTGSLRSLPGEDVNIFGFGKSLLETPRSASTISFEQMDRFNITDIDELVAFAPGTFTQSFFGVAGSLDIRGIQGENYFRGIRRIDNPGNYPQPIGASDRIDVVRGPASPIFGPAKIGGYLNFNPKSSRAGSGDYLDETTGAVSYETGSWGRNVVTAEVGGPMSDRAGYYLYGEFEDSDSFYDNSEVEQTILQASFDVDVSDKMHLQFGGMYHDFKGNQIAGWNRLTQELIDNGTYVTGTAQPLDTDGDGKISHQEYFAVGSPGLSPFLPFDSIDPAAALENTGTTTLDESNVLVDPNDKLDNETLILYVDLDYDFDNGWKITNQFYYETLDNINENAYGFSQFGDVTAIEDKLVFAYNRDFGGMQADIQLSPSIRYTDFTRGQDFINEFFDRRDLSQSNAERDPSLDTRLLSTQINDDYSEWQTGDYTIYGLAALGSFTFDNGLIATLGFRNDYIEVDTATDPDLLLFGNDGPNSASDSDNVQSWSVSLSWDTPLGLIPYVTMSEQGTIIAGQVGDIPVAQVTSGAWNDVSELFEVGVKGSFLDDSLYFALNYYEQERTDFNAQAIVTNSSSITDGWEGELRWVVNPDLVLTAGWTNMEVVIVEARDNGSLFSFLGADDVPDIDPTSFYGGVLLGAPATPTGIKAGVPENIFTFTGTYSFTENLSITASIIDVDSTTSGISNAVTLPAYTLVNAGISYKTERWEFQLNGKNLTDERYFRANFPNLFGSTIVLPELPANWQARVAFNF
jgi:iron complex outermembrane receptor protein